MMMETAPDPATLVLVMKLREALKYADTELQRRCVISTKISEALAGADAYLAQALVAQPAKSASP